jgi:Amt family ammonium transporter
MLSSLCATAIGFIVYVACGFSFASFSDLPSHISVLGGKPWNWIGAAPFFLRDLNSFSSQASVAVLLQMFAVGIAAQIPLGAAGERWRLGASCVSTAIFVGITFPLFAHWAWGGGWLTQLATNCGLGAGLIDTGGAGTIHAAGGLTALAVVWILGARTDKYSDEEIPAALPGHNLVLVLFGCFLAWLGLLGLNSAGAIIFNHAGSGAAAIVILNVTISACASALTAFSITRVRFGRPDSSLTANGWVAGLVAASSAPALLPPAAALLIGAIAGVLVVSVVNWLEMWLQVDDPTGAIAVHAAAGIWGLIAAGIFARISAQRQWVAQLVGIATLIGFVLPLSYCLNWILNCFYHQRIDPEGERMGMDLSELGAGAYPEAVMRSDDYSPH